MTQFNPILSSTATLSFPVADDGALLCPHSGAQQTRALSEGSILLTSTQRSPHPSRGGVGTSPAALQEAVGNAQRSYDATRSHKALIRLRDAKHMLLRAEVAG